MVYFTSIRPSEHYPEEHEQDIPWHDVVMILMVTKNPRKKGNKFEIETNQYYLLFEIKNNILTVINAKRVRT